MQLLDLCKLLLDEDRLRLMGLLSMEPLSQTGLLARTSMKAGVLARHLYQLQEARLVAVYNRAGEETYELNVGRIQELKRQLFAAPAVAAPQSPEEEVLSRFTDGDRLTQLPVQPAKLRIVLAWLAEEFEPGVDYPEKQVNGILDRHASDFATLRRLLIDHGFLARSGGIYRRVAEQTAV